MSATAAPPLEKGWSASEASRVGIEYLAVDPHPNPPLFKGRERAADAAWPAPSNAIALRLWGGSRASAARALLNLGSVSLQACFIAPGFGAVPGHRLAFPPRTKSEGWSAERRPLSFRTLRRGRPASRPDARLSALHSGTLRSRAALSGAVARADQPAPGRGTVVSPGRSPEPPRRQVTSLARREPHPIPLQRRLMTTPSVGWDDGMMIGKYGNIKDFIP